ncbi:MAG: aminotransferase class I/II-fold pyridoxal phosphate-dependent enzyme [Ilumatobacteraceae bacterium]
MTTEPFVPPPYPYDRLDRLAPLGSHHEGGVVDLSIGTPFDPPPASVIAAFGASGAERGYPASIGSAPLREAISAWIDRRFSLDVPTSAIAACIGTKEFVGTLPQWMRLRNPDRDTVLYPSISYPTYAMGATLAGCRAVPIPVDSSGTLQLSAVDQSDIERALLLWVNSPSNPSGQLDDLDAAAVWGRTHGIPVFSDECYVEFTWDGPRRTILETGVSGVVAVHSLSKRSNLAGARVGFYAGDPDIVGYLSEVRKHVGMMVPGPAQAAGIAALADDEHVELQRERYYERLTLMAEVLSDWAQCEIPMPQGGFYLWVPVGDAWAFVERLMSDGGALVSPGEFYGDDGASYVRVAVVQPTERIQLVADRLAGSHL